MPVPPQPSLAASVCQSGTSIALQALDASGNLTVLQSFVEASSQILEVSAGGGTASITFNGQTASGIKPGDTAATVQTALQGLSSIGSDHVLVTGDHPWLATFAGSMASTTQPAFTIGTGSLASSGPVPSLTPGTTTLAFYDSSSGQFTSVGPNWVIGGSPFGASLKCAAVGNGLQSGEWTITGLAAGCYTFYLSADGPPVGTSQSTPVRIYDGTTPRARCVVNEQSLPFTQTLPGNSGGFCPLVTTYIGSGTARILVTDEVASGDIGNTVFLNQIAVQPVDPAAATLLTAGIDNNNVVPAGTWQTFNDSSWWDGFIKLSFTPGSTYTWTFPGLMPGTYSVQTYYASRSDWDQAAIWQVYDGSTLLGSGTLNQTIAPSGGLTKTDTLSHSYTFGNLGSSFACATGTLRLVITASASAATQNTIANAALVSLQSASAYSETAAGTVTSLTSGGPITYRKNGGSPVNLPRSGAIWDADNLASPLIVWPISDTIGPSDTVTISVPANCLGTASGAVPAAVSQAVVNKVGGSLLPAVPASKTMRVGYNLMPPGTGALPMYANAVKDRVTLEYGSSPRPAQTADGYPQFTTLDGSWFLEFGTAPSNPTDARGFPAWPLTGTTTILWDGATGGYPSPRPSAGTTMTFVSLRSGQTTGNMMKVAFAVDGSNTTIAPTWVLSLGGLLDFADDADSGRVTYSGTWTAQTSASAWNGGYHRNSKVGTDKATYSLGSLPAGTYNMVVSWVQNAGNTATATYTVKESGTTNGTPFTVDQTGAPPYPVSSDLNGATISFGPHSVPQFTFAGGPVTIELTGGTDGFCLADAIEVKLVGSTVSETPFVPFTNLRVYPPDPDIDPASPPKFHPNFLKALKGTYYNRSMQLMGSNDSAMSSFADYATQTQLCYGAGGRQMFYAVTKVESYTNPNGFFPADQGCALFTVTSVNGAPLPLVHGQPFVLPDNIVAELADSSGSILFSLFSSCIEYDPVHMATNQFAMSNATNGTPGPITTITPTSPATDLGQGQASFKSVPWDDYFQLQAPSKTCWPNITAITTQACVEAIADSYMTNMPVDSTCILEIGNEPFTAGAGYPYRALYVGRSLQLVSSVNPMQGYAQLASQRHAWFAARLATQGRDGELKRLFNCLLVDTSTMINTCLYLDAHSLPADIFAVAPYLVNEPVNETTEVSLQSGLTAAQLNDNADAVWSLKTTQFQVALTAYQTAIAARTSGGKPCVLAGYEGGIVSLYLGGDQATQEVQSLATRYTPELYRTALGVLGTFQSYGFVAFQHYNLTQTPTTDNAPYSTQDYGVYLAYDPLIGIGDGSDGLHDNRPDIAGAPPAAPNLLLDVLPIAAAYQAWNGPDTSWIAVTYVTPMGEMRPITMLGKSYRASVGNNTNLPIPADCITITFTPFTVPSGAASFPDDVAVVAPSDGSAASGGIAPGSFGASATVSNTAGNIGGVFLIKFDLSGVTGQFKTGTKIQVYLQHLGTSLTPDNGQGYLLHEIVDPIAGQTYILESIV